MRALKCHGQSEEEEEGGEETSSNHFVSGAKIKQSFILPCQDYVTVQRQTVMKEEQEVPEEATKQQRPRVGALLGIFEPNVSK